MVSDILGDTCKKCGTPIGIEIDHKTEKSYWWHIITKSKKCPTRKQQIEYWNKNV